MIIKFFFNPYLCLHSAKIILSTQSLSDWELSPLSQEFCYMYCYKSGGGRKKGSASLGVIQEDGDEV